MMDSLTYQEILRTLGNLIEISNARDLRLVLTERGATVTGATWLWPSEWSLDELAAESNDQQSWRLHPRRDKTPRAGLVANCLRSVGAVIDMRGGSAYTVDVDATQVRMFGPDGYSCALELRDPAAQPPTLDPAPPILKLHRAQPAEPSSPAAAVSSPAREPASGAPALPTESAPAVTAPAVSAPTAATANATASSEPASTAPTDPDAADGPATNWTVRDEPVAHRCAANGTLTYQEILRTAGTMLDLAEVREAIIILSAQGLELRSFALPGAREFDVQSLRAQVAAQRGWRLYAHRLGGARVGLVTRCLRAVGAHLDLHGQGGRFTVRLLGDRVEVESSSGYARTFAHDTLQRRAALAQHLRASLRGAMVPRAGLRPEGWRAPAKPAAPPKPPLVLNLGRRGR